MPVSAKSLRHLASCVFFALASSASAEEGAAISFDFFSDNRRVSVLQSAVSFAKELAGGTTLSVNGKTDAISSASMTCSMCHKGAQGMQRSEAVLGVEQPVGLARVGLSYFNSREKDYSSDAITLSVSRPFNNDNGALALSYSYSMDRAHPHGWNELAKKLAKRSNPQKLDVHYDFALAPDAAVPTEVPDATVQNASIGWTQVLTRTTIAQLTYEYSFFSGYQQDPYHLVAIDGTDHFEKHPQTRRRHAIAARLKQSLNSSTTLGVDYRHYRDNWGIGSQTFALELFRYLGKNGALLNTGYRYYKQSAASFYRDRHTTDDVFISSDERLQAYSTHFIAIKLSQLATGPLAALPFMQDTRFSIGYARYIGGARSQTTLSSGRRLGGSAPDLKANLLHFELAAPF